MRTPGTNRTNLLWIYYYESYSQSESYRVLSERFMVSTLSGGPELVQRAEFGLRSRHFHVALFDLGDPGTVELADLRTFRLKYPSIPIIMLTRKLSASQILWALRTRVWNVFMNPVESRELESEIGILCEHVRKRQGRPGRQMLLPSGAGRDPTPTTQEGRNDYEDRISRVIRGAKAYIEGHLSDGISGRNVAEFCAMSYFHFSRTFKRVTSQCFRDFVTDARITKAKELLAQPGASVTSVCLEVGFTDLSYFSRVFQKKTGVSPSVFRERQHASRNIETPLLAKDDSQGALKRFLREDGGETALLAKDDSQGGINMDIGMNRLMRFLEEDGGLAAVEYAVAGGLIAAAIFLLHSASR